MYRPDKFRDPWRASLAVAVAGVDYANGPEDGGGSRQYGDSLVHDCL